MGQLTAATRSHCSQGWRVPPSSGPSSGPGCPRGDGFADPAGGQRPLNRRPEPRLRLATSAQVRSGVKLGVKVGVEVIGAACADDHRTDRRWRERGRHAVLSNARLVVGAEDYYLRQVADGLEEYYTGAGESPGVWAGSAAHELGLAGEVTPEALRQLIRGRHPATGSELTNNRLPPERRVAGWDLTMSAPKSVSLLYGLCGDSVAEAVREAHDQAVHDALGYLERHAAFARRGHAGSDPPRHLGLGGGRLPAPNLTAGEPQLHTHVLVANLVHADDGRWSSLYSSLLYYQGRAAGFVYQASLRAGLVRRLGVTFAEPVNGCAELAGLPATVLKAFSSRHAEIEERLAELGGNSRRTHELATLGAAGRRRRGSPPSTYRDRWRAKAAELGVEVDELEALVSSPRAEPQLVSLDATTKHLLGPKGLTASDSTFERRHVVMALAGEHRDGLFLAELESAVDKRCSPSRRSSRSGHSGRAAGRCRPRTSCWSWKVASWQRAEQARDGRAGVVDTEVVEAVLAERPGTAEEQAAMVRRITGSGAGVDVVVGKAGAGKTYALDAARAAWQRAGFVVRARRSRQPRRGGATRRAPASPPARSRASARRFPAASSLLPTATWSSSTRPAWSARALWETASFFADLGGAKVVL